MATDEIQILHIEDNPEDMVLVREILDQDNNFFYCMQNADLLELALENFSAVQTDIILLDLNLPDSTGFATFQKMKERALGIPIIVMSVLTEEATALHAVKNGAQDYLFKGSTDVNTLIRSIRYAIEREKLQAELRLTLSRMKTLSGMLPICAACKDIRDDNGFWHQLEVFVQDNSEAKFTHGLCPKCLVKLYPEFS